MPARQTEAEGQRGSQAKSKEHDEKESFNNKAAPSNTETAFVKQNTGKENLDNNRIRIKRAKAKKGMEDSNIIQNISWI